MSNKRQERNKQARIRYNLLRSAGYSVKDAQRLRYITNERHHEFIDIEGIKTSRTTGKVLKGRHYKNVVNIVNHDERIKDLREFKYKSVLTRHGYLTNKPKDPKYDTNEHRRRRDEYYNIVMAIKKRDNLTNDQAWYFAHIMLKNNLTYHETRRQLLADEDFERYRQSRRGRRR